MTLPFPLLYLCSVSKTKVSIILIAKNEAANLEHCLTGLAEQLVPFSYEVQVVDNQSSDSSHRIARSFAKSHPNFHVWRQKKVGIPAARNLGARKANGEILVFTDANCRFPATWLSEITKPLLLPQRLPVGAVGGFTEREFEGARSGRALKLWEQYADELFQLWEQDRTKAFPGFLPWAPGCNLAVKKELFLALGGFEESWKLAAYDVDFCWRLALTGFQLAYAPRAHLIQKRKASLKTLLSQIENVSFYNQLLLKTYEKNLRYPPVVTKREKILTQARSAIESAKAIRSFEELSHRGVDSLVKLAAAKGQLRALYSRLRPSKELQASRQGVCSAVENTLPKNYRHLHEQGWCYWKDPADYDVDGDLVLFQAREREWFRLNESAWKVWEVKSTGGQSEDAAALLCEDRNDPEALNDVDHLTLDLHRKDLLP